jgi:hypothetical protein
MSRASEVEAFVDGLEQQQGDEAADGAGYRSAAEYERLKRKAASLAKELRDTLVDRDRLQVALDMVTTIEDGHVKPPAWASPDTSTKPHTGIPTLMLSDLHLDEVVNPDEVEGLNAYNRDIAEMRLERTFKKAIETTRDYLSGVSYEGIYLILGGDIISGWIHEELSETNEDTVPGTVAYWLDPLAAGIGMLAEEFGNVHIAGVVGNHGRVTKKPRAKKRVRDNIDWLIYKMLMRDFRNQDNITWQVPESADCMVSIYDTNFLVTHGDQFRGGSGIAGALSPLMLGQHRKARRQMIVDRPFDHLVMGHWHMYWAGRGLLVNGSTKGIDEYAYQGNFDYDPPKQAMWLTTPEHGVTFNWPVFSSAGREKEGW